MKQNRLRTIFAAVLAIVSMGAWADTANRIVIAEIQNGTITAGTVAETGEQTVTLTVTPADEYYIETSDITVSKTGGTAQTRGTTPGYADKLAVTAVNVDNRGAGTYQFTVPDGYGAYVEATFTSCIAITPAVTIDDWTYGETAKEPKVTGNTGNGEVAFTYAKKGSDSFSASIPENANEYTVKASIAAAGHYLAGEATADFTIAKAAGSISYETASISKTYGDADFTNELTIVGDGTVAYSSDNTDVAEVDAETGKVSIVGDGTAEITATVTDGTNYTYAAKTASYTLGVGTAVMEVTSSGYEGIYDGQPHGISVTAPKGATVKYGESEGSYTLDASPTYTDAGTYTVCYEATMANYTPVKGSAVVKISKAAGSISYKTASISKTYGDADFTNELTIVGDGTVAYSSDNTDVAEVDAETGKVSIVGDGTAEITATVTDGTNYTYAVKTANYTLGVGTAVMEVTSSGYEGIYDGQPHGISVKAPKGATVKYGESEGSYTLDASPTYTDAGTYTVCYEATMANYTPVKGSAVVKISKAAGSISYKTASISKTYGEADFTNELTIVGDGTVAYSSDNTDVAEVDAETGKVSIVGDGTAEITATVTDGTNYTYAAKTASYTLGVGTAVMEVTSSGYEGIYDGQPHGISVTAPKGATVKYGEMEGSYTLDASPTYTDTGTYIVYYQVTKDNYTTVKGNEKVIIILEGDANGDGIVNAADIVEMVNAKNGNASENFILKNVDFDGDGKITDSDINAVADIILGKAQ